MVCPSGFTTLLEVIQGIPLIYMAENVDGPSVNIKIP
jgi:hypothetical protein